MSGCIARLRMTVEKDREEAHWAGRPSGALPEGEGGAILSIGEKNRALDLRRSLPRNA